MPAIRPGSNLSLLYKCDTCPFQSDRKYDLTRHKKTHLPEKPYKCPTPGCGFATRQKSNLETHLRAHTGEKSKVCPHEGCTYKTHEPALLTRHRKRKHNYVPHRAAPKQASAPVRTSAPVAPAFPLVAPSSFDSMVVPAGIQGAFATSLADLIPMPLTDFYVPAPLVNVPSNPLFDDSMYPEPCAAEIFEGIWDHVSPRASCEPEVPQLVAPAMQFGGMLEPFGFSEGGSSSSASAQNGVGFANVDPSSLETFEDMWNSFINF